MVKNYKIFKIAPTCFGSQRIHHQGALRVHSTWLKLQETCWRTFKYFIILTMSTNYIFVHLLDSKVFVIDARCKYADKLYKIISYP